mmetsp:Transcript_13719/g.32631  ORF Transcript_13719/g.32631 Transcript_13719/m.32631 type:complete len:267 (+) Transcript_13719:360-1160(+)
MGRPPRTWPLPLRRRPRLRLGFARRQTCSTGTRPPREAPRSRSTLAPSCAPRAPRQHWRREARPGLMRRRSASTTADGAHASRRSRWRCRRAADRHLTRRSGWPLPSPSQTRARTQSSPTGAQRRAQRPGSRRRSATRGIRARTAAWSRWCARTASPSLPSPTPPAQTPRRAVPAARARAARRGPKWGRRGVSPRAGSRPQKRLPARAHSPRARRLPKARGRSRARGRTAARRSPAAARVPVEAPWRRSRRPRGRPPRRRRRSHLR